MAILTIRLIKSFAYRNVKNLVIRDVDLSQTSVRDLMGLIYKRIDTETPWISWSPNATAFFDTLKLYTQPFGAKSQHLVINFEDDDALILYSPAMSSCPSTKTLEELGCRNETELSLFNHEQYRSFKANPENLW